MTAGSWTCAFCSDPVPDDGTPRPITSHYDARHNPLTAHLRDQPQVPDLNDWRSRAIAAVKTLARTGQEFFMYQVTEIAGDPPNHRTAMGSFASEIEHAGLAHVVRYDRSPRPDTKASACAVWVGGPRPPREAAA